MADLVMKQARAIIDDRTTTVCLDIHGIIMPVDEPFETLAGDFMQPPFHVHCRTLVGPYMPGFIKEARKAANAELKKRPRSERRRGPGGPDPSTIPGPVTGKPPSGFSRRDEEQAFLNPGILFTPAKDKPVPKTLPLQEAGALVDTLHVRGTEDEHQAAGLYMAGMEWNNLLRAGTEPNEFQQERIDQLTSLIRKQKPFGQHISLFRGMAGWFLPEEQSAVGMVIKDPAFLSTSLNMAESAIFAGIGDGVLVEIIARPKDRGLSIPHARAQDMTGIPEEYREVISSLSGEAEIVLEPGTALQVVESGTRTVNGNEVRYVKAVIVDE